MATTEYDFNATQTEIISRALRIVGAGDEIDGGRYNAAALALNAVVKEWQSRHIFLWTQKELSFDLAATDKDYALSTDPAVLHVTEARLRDTAGEDVVLEQVSFREYKEIPNKDDAGDPVLFAVDNQPAPTMYVWPVPTDATKDIFYLATVKLKDLDAISTNPDIKPMYINALTYALARDLSDEYGLPIAERNYLAVKADDLFSAIKRSDRNRSDSRTMRSAFK